MSADPAGRAPTREGPDPAGDSAPAPWDHIHREAVDAGRSTYVDPETGLSVFTELALRRRGWCCGSGCRHCPYGHEAVGRATGDTGASTRARPEC